MYYYGDEPNVNEVPDFEAVYGRNRKVIEKFGLKDWQGNESPYSNPIDSIWLTTCIAGRQPAYAITV
jgi:hypothetical protein